MNMEQSLRTDLCVINLNGVYDLAEETLTAVSRHWPTDKISCLTGAQFSSLTNPTFSINR
jgi:hypothetical protein